MLVLVREADQFTYELSLRLRLVGDGVANDAGVYEGEGGDQSLGQAG